MTDTDSRHFIPPSRRKIVAARQRQRDHEEVTYRCKINRTPSGRDTCIDHVLGKRPPENVYDPDFFQTPTAGSQFFETDIDTGAQQQLPLVRETNLDTSPAKLATAPSKSMGDVSGSPQEPRGRALPQQQLRGRAVSESRLDPDLEDEEDPPPRLSRGTTRRSTHDVRIDKSMERLHLPKWYTEGEDLPPSVTLRSSQRNLSDGGSLARRSKSAPASRKNSTANLSALGRDSMRSRQFDISTLPRPNEPPSEDLQRHFRLPSVRYSKQAPAVRPVRKMTLEEIMASAKPPTPPKPASPVVADSSAEMASTPENQPLQNGGLSTPELERSPRSRRRQLQRGLPPRQERVEQRESPVTLHSAPAPVSIAPPAVMDSPPRSASPSPRQTNDSGYTETRGDENSSPLRRPVFLESYSEAQYVDEAPTDERSVSALYTAQWLSSDGNLSSGAEDPEPLMEDSVFSDFHTHPSSRPLVDSTVISLVQNSTANDSALLETSTREKSLLTPYDSGIRLGEMPESASPLLYAPPFDTLNAADYSTASTRNYTQPSHPVQLLRRELSPSDRYAPVPLPAVRHEADPVYSEVKRRSQTPPAIDIQPMTTAPGAQFDSSIENQYEEYFPRVRSPRSAAQSPPSRADQSPREATPVLADDWTKPGQLMARGHVVRAASPREPEYPRYNGVSPRRSYQSTPQDFLSTDDQGSWRSDGGTDSYSHPLDDLSTKTPATDGPGSYSMPVEVSMPYSKPISPREMQPTATNFDYNLPLRPGQWQQTVSPRGDSLPRHLEDAPHQRDGLYSEVSMRPADSARVSTNAPLQKHPESDYILPSRQQQHFSQPQQQVRQYDYPPQKPLEQHQQPPQRYDPKYVPAPPGRHSQATTPDPQVLNLQTAYVSTRRAQPPPPPQRNGAQYGGSLPREEVGRRAEPVQQNGHHHQPQPSSRNHPNQQAPPQHRPPHKPPMAPLQPQQNHAQSQQGHAQPQMGHAQPQMGHPPRSSASLQPASSINSLQSQQSGLRPKPILKAPGSSHGQQVKSARLNQEAATRIPNTIPPAAASTLDAATCANTACAKVIPWQAAKEKFKVCGACSAAFCTRECETSHWAPGTRKCVFSLVEKHCKHVLRAVQKNKTYLADLSRTAQLCEKAHGRGSLLLNCDAEDVDRILEDSNALLQLTVEYQTVAELHQSAMLGQPLDELVSLCQRYTTGTKFVFTVAISCNAPNDQSGRVVMRSVKLPLAKSGPFRRGLLVTGHLAQPARPADRHARENTFMHVQQVLRHHGIDLLSQQPLLYSSLCHYVSRSATFKPTAFYAVSQQRPLHVFLLPALNTSSSIAVDEKLLTHLNITVAK